MKTPDNGDWDHARRQIFKMIGYDWGKPLDRYLYDYIKYLQANPDSQYQDEFDKLRRLKEIKKKKSEGTKLDWDDVEDAINITMGTVSSFPSAVLLRVMARELLTYAPEGALEKSMSQKPLKAYRSKPAEEFLCTRFDLVARTALLFGGEVSRKVLKKYVC